MTTTKDDQPIIEQALPFAPWLCCAQIPGSITHPDQLPAINSAWLPAAVPGTVAAALQTGGHLDFNHPRDLDAEDWWYRTTFAAPNLASSEPCYLCFDGLATLAEIWLNGQKLLATDNMFRAYQINIRPYLRMQNELVLGFRALAEDLKIKRARPRWKTNLVLQQQLRWRRTSLLGRIPGWSPPVAPVGPWRAVRLEHGLLTFSEFQLCSSIRDGDGHVLLRATALPGLELQQARLQVGNSEAPVEIQETEVGLVLQAAVRIPSPPLWWPHTHGEQPLLDCALHISTADSRFTVACGKTGFRHLDVSRTNFGIRVNGVSVYCRGACWTVSDIMTLGSSSDTVRQDLQLARAAGVNMLRVGGTMVYESDSFYQICNELGIMVWQDFMFANMDYPVEDAEFLANIEAESRYQLSRLSRHPAVIVFCGNSEVEQQAAMLGVPREHWRNHWFGARLPQLCTEYNPEAAYVPSTPSGGVLPFHVSAGITHYYGVGAYLRSTQELRKADVKFTPECLAFANVPETETIHVLMDGLSPAPHHPRWKQRVPRDTGAGWDFEDVRDYYLQQFFQVDPVRLRSCDTPRYLQLSRVVTGEMMTQVFAEWRSTHTHNQGGLLWFFKDLWPGAGWGIVDSRGLPKAPYYYLRRSWLTRQITVTDEGLDGLHVHVSNETTSPLAGFVELLLLKDGHITVACQEIDCLVPPRGRQTFSADELLGSFYDITYAYRFGPPKHDLVVATLFDEQHQVLSEAFYFVQPKEPAFLPSVNLTAAARQLSDDCYQITLQADHFLQSVSLDVPGFLPEDNYFHLPPSRVKTVRLSAWKEEPAKFRGHIEALNLRNPIAVRIQ